MSIVVVEAKDLRQVYKIRRGMFREPAQLQAVGGVSFAIEAGRTLAVVGESGCGKSTLARMVTLIEKPAGGTLMLDGTDAIDTPPQDKVRLRQAVQLVFQNPYGSLNPRKKVSDVLEAPLEIDTSLARPSGMNARAQCSSRWACGRNTRTAIRTCSRAGSASASRSHAR